MAFEDDLSKVRMFYYENREAIDTATAGSPYWKFKELYLAIEAMERAFLTEPDIKARAYTKNCAARASKHIVNYIVNTMDISHREVEPL